MALVPRPRRHLVTYHGVLAPAASLRPRIVPRAEADEAEEAAGGGGQPGEEGAPFAENSALGFGALTSNGLKCIVGTL